MTPSTNFSSFLSGFTFGFLLAATVGPVWVLILRRTLAHGPLFGFVSGLGVVTADAIFGAIAALGLTAVSSFLLEQRVWLSVAGGMFLLWLGANILRSPITQGQAADAPARSLPAAFVTMCGFTLTNPATIMGFVAIFAGLGMAQSASYEQAAWVVTGVVLGSLLWWTILALAAGRLRRRLEGPRGDKVLRAVNIVAGITILGFGLAQLGSLALK